jgi:serine/threonine-protein kinase RsbT
MSREMAQVPERRVVIRDDSDIAMARKWTRELARSQGLATNAAEALVTAVSEITRNVLVHASSGELVLSVVDAGGRRGIAAEVRDQGPGIADIDLALRDGHSTRGGLGLGLPSARRLVNEFRIRSAEGSGTTVSLTQWLPDSGKEQR